jgi:arylsulfatase A-like enzyme
VHLPGGTPGVCDAFTEHVDILPTLLDALQKPAPRQCDGFSLLPWLTGDLPASDALRHWRTSAHFEFDFLHSQAESALGLDMENACLNVIRDQHYKYVHFADLPCLLFDLQQDRFELHNIAADAPAIVARYAQQLLSWRLRTTDKTLSHLQIKPGVGLADMSR